MRFKFLRRHLSVSAPRVAIRSQLPWPLRMLFAAVVLGFSAAIALWAFETGQELSGIEGRGARAELARLRAEVDLLRDERERGAAVANAAESLITAERATQERLAQQVRQLEAEKQALEADLGFFEKLFPASGDPLQLRGLQAEPKHPGEMRYQLLVMQNGRVRGDFNGQYDLVVSGTLGGKPWSMTLPGGPQPLRLRQYARVEGLFDHPADAVITTVEARVTDAHGAVRASQTLAL